MTDCAIIQFSQEESDIFTAHVEKILTTIAFYHQTIMFKNNNENMAPLYIFVLFDGFNRVYNMYIAREKFTDRDITKIEPDALMTFETSKLKLIAQHILNFNTMFYYDPLRDKFLLRVPDADAEVVRRENVLFKIDYALEQGHRVKECSVCFNETTHRTFCVTGAGETTTHSTSVCWECYIRIPHNGLRLCPVCRAPIFRTKKDYDFMTNNHSAYTTNGDEEEEESQTRERLYLEP